MRLLPFYLGHSGPRLVVPIMVELLTQSKTTTLGSGCQGRIPEREHSGGYTRKGTQKNPYGNIRPVGRGNLVYEAFGLQRD